MKIIQNIYKISFIFLLFFTSTQSFATKSIYTLKVNFWEPVSITNPDIDTQLELKRICTNDSLIIRLLHKDGTPFTDAEATQVTWTFIAYINFEEEYKTITAAGKNLNYNEALRDTTTLIEIKLDSSNSYPLSTGTLINGPFKISPRIELGSDIFSCTGFSTTLQNQLSTTLAGYSILWSNGVTTASQTINTPGLYSVTVTNFIDTLAGSSLDRCLAIDQARFSNYPQPIVAAGGTLYRCFKENLQLNAVFLAQSTPGQYTYNWQPNTNFIAAQNTIQNPIVGDNDLIGESRTYTLTVTDGNFCRATSTVTAIKNPELKVKIAQSDTTICKFTALSLPAAIVSTATGTPNTISGYKYNWSPATGLNNTTISSPLANAISTAGINYTVTATDFRNCTARDFVNIKKTSLEMAFVSPIASVVSVCSGEIVTNLQISRKGGVAPFIFTWSPLGILTKNTDSLYNTKAITSNQKILVSIADASRCTDKDSVSIVLKPLPTLQVKNDSVVNICTGNTKEIKVLLDTEASENNISWTPNTISTYKPTFTAATEAKEEIFTFTVVSNISGCSSASNIKIGTKISTPISIAGPEGTLKINENYDFNANESGLQYAWQIRSVSGVSDFTPAISNLQKLSQTFDSPGGYTISLTGTNADGCVSGAFIDILVKSKIIKFYVPTVFSPASADEKNKTFKVFYNNVDNDIDKSQFRITIFNTLGNKVFESDNFDEMSSTGWAGEGFATGVYTWIVQYKVQGSEPEKIYNTVTLLK